MMMNALNCYRGRRFMITTFKHGNPRICRLLTVIFLAQKETQRRKICLAQKFSKSQSSARISAGLAPSYDAFELALIRAIGGQKGLSFLNRNQRSGVQHPGESDFRNHHSSKSVYNREVLVVPGTGRCFVDRESIRFVAH